MVVQERAAAAADGYPKRLSDPTVDGMARARWTASSALGGWVGPGSHLRSGSLITPGWCCSGASKWSPIEHRLFSEFSKNWAGHPLRSYDTVLDLIRTTTTQTGLRVRAHLIDQENRKGASRGQAPATAADRWMPTLGSGTPCPQAHGNTASRSEMPTAWRIVKRRHARTAFDGEGARQYGGRWHRPGTSVVYAAETRALRVLEVLVGITSVTLLDAYVLIPATFDDTLVTDVDVAKLPDDWRQSPPHPSTQRIGDEWADQQSSAVLRVPSAIVPEEFNYLFNPGHPNFPQIQIGAAKEVSIDPRLLR